MLTPDTVERFWMRVDRTGECWIWTGRFTRDGYGRASIGNQRESSAHRVSFEIANGTIPAGLCVLHRCDDKRCVNPAHLFLGTKKQNSEDMVSKARQARGEGAGSSKLTADQVKWARDAYAAGLASMRGIGRLLGINPATVHAIVHRRNWRHV